MQQPIHRGLLWFRHGWVWSWSRSNRSNASWSWERWEWRWWSMVMVMRTMINDNIHDHHRWCHFIHDNMIVMMIADDQWWSMTINDDQWSMIINDIQSTMLNGDQWRWLSNDHQFESLLRSVIVLGVCWVFFNDGGETNEPNSTTSWPTHVPTTWLPLLK